MPMRVLVTGAAGRLGSEVVKVLWDAGLEVRALDIQYRGDLPVPVQMADLREHLSVYGHLDGCQALVHLGNHPHAYAAPSPQQLYRENVAMNMHAFQAAVDVGAKKLIYASSVQAICGTRSGEEDKARPSCLPYLPLDGDVPACPGNAYALSKEAGERQLRYFARLEPELSCTSIRFPFLMRRQWMQYVRSSRQMRHLGNLDEGFSYLWTGDAASLVLAVLERQPPGYHQLFPAAPEPYLGMPIPEIVQQYYPDVPCKVPPERMESLVDITGLKEALGWEPQGGSLFNEEAAEEGDVRKAEETEGGLRLHP